MFNLPFVVSKSVIIKKPKEEIYCHLVDFKNWPLWSPWFCQERECTYSTSGKPGEVGHGQAWDGKRIGSGEMQIIRLKPDEQIAFDLKFLKPWKSESQVQFLLEAIENDTKVTWNMQGKIPIFLFFLKKMMQALVGGDYQRGLDMLKDLLETGRVDSKVDYQDEQDSEAFYYIGYHRKCRISEIGPLMKEDFQKLGNQMESGNLPKADHVVSLYHQFDMVGGDCEYTTAVTFRNSVPEIPEGMVSGQLPKHRSLNVLHTGPYKYLGNAWATVMGAHRALRKKVRKEIPMYEVYNNNPHEVAESELSTSVRLPIR